MTLGLSFSDPDLPEGTPFLVVPVARVLDMATLLGAVFWESSQPPDDEPPALSTTPQEPTP